jgi:hypothetical protein
MSKAQRERLPFNSADAGSYNAMRDRWRELALGWKLSKAGHRVAALLPTFVNREFGYAFPTDQQIAELLNTSTKTVKRGMTDLDQAGLIERETRPKRDDKREVIGQERRIYLTVPEVTGHVRGEGTKGGGEGTHGVPIIRTISLSMKEVRSNARGLADVPSPFTGDVAFVDAFDRMLIAQTGGKAGGNIERVVQQAFDAATYSDPAFMPFEWRSVCRLRADHARAWFIQRAELLLRRAA